LMSLPDSISHLINSHANSAGVAEPTQHDDLFRIGVLDSFTLVDLISILEAELGITIPDRDVRAENFQSISAIEQYVESRKP